MKYKNPDESWCRLELFRWQYGELPKENDKRKINLAEASRLMAIGIDDRKAHPFNVAMCLAYLGRLAAKLADREALGKIGELK